MSEGSIDVPGAKTLRDLLCWRGGETDLWPLFADRAATAEAVRGLAEPFRGAVDVVLGPDPGGVLFGPLVAGELGTAFAPVCRDRDFFFKGPHEALTVAAAGGQLLVHRAALPRGTRALLVDDWSESGSTVLGVKALVDAAEAELTAVSFLVDSLTDDARATLSRGKVAVHALTTAAALPQAA